MGKYKLLIVESPTKAKTIQKYLGDEYKVMASKGHIKDLPPKELGIEIDKNFKMKIVQMSGKGDVIKQIKEAAKNASEVLLAPDPDREGEAIAYHLKSILPKIKISRVLFNSITKDTVKKAIEESSELNKNRYDAQKARRVLDRLVGYKISPLLCRALTKKASAGRVQSVALRLVIEREKEIEDFVPQHWFDIKSSHSKDNIDFNGTYFGSTINKKETLKDKNLADKILSDIKGKDFTLDKKEEKDLFRKPKPPFTTSKLQQEAYKKLNFTTDQTMKVAQKLYEGFSINGEVTGLITYMRTDSTRSEPKAVEALRKKIIEKHGEEYLSEKVISYSKKKKNSQDAHEAIRPTSMDHDPDSIVESLDKDSYKLYKLIWDTFMMSQMKDAKYSQLNYFFSCESHIFKTSGSTLIFKGYQLLENKKDSDKELPKIEEKEIVKQSKTAKVDEKKSSPPKLYTESTLVEKMEEKGIGRPSTYAAIISNLIFRKYIEKIKNEFNSTEFGREIYGLLIKNFADQIEISFTSKVEKELDLIENGEKKFLEVMDSFWDKLNKTLTDAQKLEIFKYKPSEEQKTGLKCLDCETGEYLIRKTKAKPNKPSTEFLSCSDFPSCRSAKNFEKVEDKIKIVEGKKYKIDYHPKEVCKKCGAKLSKKKGKYGFFYSCVEYKNTGCKYILSEKKKAEVISNCKKCDEGKMVKRAKKGSQDFFLGCNRFPKCKATEKFIEKKETKDEIEKT